MCLIQGADCVFRVTGSTTFFLLNTQLVTPKKIYLTVIPLLHYSKN